MNRKSAGRFGISHDKDNSKTNGLYLAAYIPDKFTIQLFDSSVVRIDTAWVESAWAYNEKGEPEAAPNFGQNFIIPINEKNADEFLFTLKLLDKGNQVFTNGIEETRCVLHPTTAKEIIEVVVEQKNPDENLGWTKPIVTDTIRFIKIKK